jgi:DNA-binding NarL/FixJ family response regulator
MINVLLADDLGMFREGLGLLLENGDEVKIMMEASNGIEVLRLLPDYVPDVLVTDIQMPEMDGVELTKEIRKFYPQIKVVALTMFKEDYLILDMLEAGAKGFLLKSSPKEKLIAAIKAVHAGGFYFCDSTSLKLSKMIASSKIDGLAEMELEKFSRAEREIIRLICEQFSSKEISERLSLGLRTVESYRHKIFDKIGVKNMAGLVIYAIRWGLFRP